MLRLFFHLVNDTLKVREALPHEPFSEGCVWEDTIEFEMVSTPLYTMLWTSFLPDLESKYAQSLLRLIGARYPVSDRYAELKGLCPSVVFQSQDDEWIFFGGTFDPWHAGHQACLNLIPDDATCLVLPDRNPFKAIRHIEPVSSILELSTRISFKKKQFLVPTFYLDEKINPTVTWVERLRKLHPEKKISLLMGHDALIHVTEWIRSADLLRLIDTIYSVSRLEPEEARDPEVQKIKAIAPGIKIHFLGRHSFEHLSSTELRRKSGRF